MVCASPKNSKKRTTILCSCVHLFLKQTADPVHMTTIIAGSGNAEIFRDGIHWSNDRIHPSKRCYFYKKISIVNVQNAFCGDPRLMRPWNPYVQDIFYDCSTSHSMVCNPQSEKNFFAFIVFKLVLIYWHILARSCTLRIGGSSSYRKASAIITCYPYMLLFSFFNGFGGG